MNTFSFVVGPLRLIDRDRYVSPMHRTDSILLTVRMVAQRRPREDWRSDEKAIESLAMLSTSVTMRSPTSREVGRKFRDLIQDEKVERRSW